MTMAVRPGGGDPEEFGTVAFYAAVGKALVTMCAVIPVLYAIELVNEITHSRLDNDFGIVPRNLSRIPDIFSAPFLHVSFTHLYGNSLPLVITGTLALAAGARRFIWSTLLIIVVSGLGVWLVSPSNTLTVGASGVIFGYIGFLFMRGIVERSALNIAVAILIGLLCGLQLSLLVPTNLPISWQAHLFGFIGGSIAAVIFRRKRPKPAVTTTVGDPPTTLTLPTIG